MAKSVGAGAAEASVALSALLRSPGESQAPKTPSPCTYYLWIKHHYQPITETDYAEQTSPHATTLDAANGWGWNPSIRIDTTHNGIILSGARERSNIVQSPRLMGPA
ncbi:uncharacterized protein B0I36DRAFT_349321 [Microdochium trichocladiopsis]|uniref:Uncharacterized protein n=1 Tax=Microdochium trichocladiopsis TaxID=1682393 RepID=A0A9P8Y9F3_9PEZI|nr:uncharacterized protein B0I36DRAFT_349321 [Microdochium trichocladiopsis]KAH7031214.1 hypothetical protein B0I36DRAFT_349321 [Microdochium trichocladiopsis]